MKEEIFEIKNRIVDLKKLPEYAGVYSFWASKDKPIYIGKAKNLKSRIKTYFQKKSSPKSEKIVSQAKQLKIIKLNSEIEALILESELIKKFQPKLNLLFRDDKNYFFVAFSKNKFPKVFLTHQPSKNKLIDILGPFVEGASLKSALKYLRAVYPFCTCLNADKKPHQRLCPNSELGLCFGWCCSKMRVEPKDAKKVYNQNLKKIKTILKGRAQKILKSIKKEIKSAIKIQDFEKAKDLKGNLQRLEQVISHKQVLKTKPEPMPKLEAALKSIFKRQAQVKRIEAYDISLIQGSQAVGSMVVFENLQKNPGQYKRFRIKTIFQNNDTAMIKEVLQRRLKHKEWPQPDLILIDGGKGQFNATWQILKNFKLIKKISLAAFAKPNEELVLRNGKVKLARTPILRNLIKKIDDEAHRFAISYHRLLRKKFVLAT